MIYIKRIYSLTELSSQEVIRLPLGSAIVQPPGNMCLDSVLHPSSFYLPSTRQELPSWQTGWVINVQVPSFEAEGVRWYYTRLCNWLSLSSVHVSITKVNNNKCRQGLGHIPRNSYFKCIIKRWILLSLLNIEKYKHSHEVCFLENYALWIKIIHIVLNSLLRSVLNDI